MLTVSSADCHDVTADDEFRARDGLPNFFAELQASGPVRGQVKEILRPALKS